MSCDALNLFMHDFSRTLVLLWEVHSSLAFAQELCFPKQHYESIVPSKPGINGQTVPLTVMGLIAIGLTLYSYHMCMRATVSLSAPRQEPLHEGISPRATVLVEGLTN